jgi:hypothetical protein
MTASSMTLLRIFLLEDQGSVHDYLGISITSGMNTKTITIMQTGLIKSIIANVGLTMNSNAKTTPTVSIQYPDTGGPPRQETWNYHSVIGKLNFIAQSTRPVISFTVYQCAQFSHAPTALHELAVKHLIPLFDLYKRQGFNPPSYQEL